MRSSVYQTVVGALLAAALVIPVSSHADSKAHGEGQGHKVVTGVITDKAGQLAVKLPDGAVQTLNPKASQRHGHEVPKPGDEVTVVLDHNNAIIDMHPKGHEGSHRFVTGNLVYVGKMKKEIKLSTPEGEKVFPIERLEIKTGGIEEGTLVTAEVNEAGTIIDLHRAGVHK